MLLHKQSSAYKLGDGALHESCVCMVSSVSCVRMPVAAGLFRVALPCVLPLAARKLPLSSWALIAMAVMEQQMLWCSLPHTAWQDQDFVLAFWMGTLFCLLGNIECPPYTHACRFD